MAAISYRLRSWARVRWRAACALTLVVVIAGGVALALVAGATRTITAPARYSSWRGAAFDVSIQQADGPPRTAELAALAATARVETATFVFGGLEKAGSEAPVDALVFAGTQGPIGTRLVEGREPDPAHPDEFVATQSFVASIGAAVGAHLHLVTFTQQQADEAGFDAPVPAGPTLTATLVGVIDGPADLSDGYAVALFPPTLLDQGDVGVSATVGVASLAPGFTVEDLRKQLDDLPNGDAFSLDVAEWISSDVRAAVSAQGQGLAILGVIVAAAAVVVLGQLLTRQLRIVEDEQTVLLALGVSRTQIIAEPLSRAALVALAGAVGSAVVAYLCSGLFPVDFVRRVEPHPGRRFDLLVHGVGPALLALALLLWVLCALVLDARATKGLRPSTFTEKLAAAIPSAQVSTAIRFAFERTARRARSATTPLVGLTLVFCVLSGALTFGANLGRLVDEPAQYGANYDLAIGAGATEISPEIQHGLAGSPDVGGLTLYGTTTVSVGTASLDIIGMRPVKGSLLPETLDGRLPQGDDEIALGSVAARRLGVKVGEEVGVSGASGPRTLRVTGLAVVPPVGGADGVGESGLVTDEGFLAIDPSATMNTAAVQIAPGAASGATDRIAALTGSSAGQGDRPSAILNLRRVRNIPYLVAASVGALAMLSLGHLMINVVRRRRRDLAILRAVGATSRWLTGVVHWQATITTIAVLAVAVPTGSALGSALYRRLVDHVGARTDVIVPFAWLGATLLALLVLANLVAAVPARRARHDAPARVLTQG